MLMLKAPAACKLEKIGDLTFFQQQDAIVSAYCASINFTSLKKCIV